MRVYHIIWVLHSELRNKIWYFLLFFWYTVGIFICLCNLILNRVAFSTLHTFAILVIVTKATRRGSFRSFYTKPEVLTDVCRRGGVLIFLYPLGYNLFSRQFICKTCYCKIINEALELGCDSFKLCQKENFT